MIEHKFRNDLKVRVCRECGTEQPLDDFPRSPKSKDGHINKCKACVRKYRLLNSQKILDKKRAGRREAKVKAILYKGGKCEHCGYESLEHPTVFDFHHTDADTKDFKISSIIHYSWAKVEIELDKCILLCANCHRILHEKEVV